MSKERQLTGEIGGKLIHDSFWFSQGRGELQELYWDGIGILRPNWYIETQEQVEEFGLKGLEAIDRFFRAGPLSHRPISEEEKIDQFLEQVEEMTTRINAKTADLDTTVSGIIIYTSAIDHRNLTWKNGRPVRGRDPWQSFFKDYIIDKTQPELPEFQELFSLANQMWRSESMDSILGKSLLPRAGRLVDEAPRCPCNLDLLKMHFHLERIWESKHPGRKFNPE